MKKLLYILFILVYLLPTVGLTVANHFCGDTLVSTNVVLAKALDEPVNCCPDEPEDNSCCSDQIVTYKSDDSHFASAKSSLENISLDYTLIHTETSYRNNFVKSFSFQSTTSHYQPGTPAYIINRTLLI
ncbi:MAG: hypothetical protein FD143_1032 [Ignavibacteria bacterium]|nr:MAG: hypothetical protein FD143_1032 [Ignavibacteria bacterium]KAF0160963.1 MAG: hypothetical protein FD188_1184 [Ignavibacteria bacterium]